MMDTEKPASLILSPRLVFGLGVMVLGLLLTLDTFGIVETRPLVRFWPVLLIAVGLAKLGHAIRCGRAEGLGLALVGVALLLNNLDVVRLRQLVPVAILAVGTVIVWKALRVRHRGRPLLDSSARVEAFTFMGGVQRATSARDFQGGNASAVMGACEIDLSQASIQGGEAVIDTFAFWGGVEIKVPEDWRVETQGLAILGGFVDSTKRPLEDGKRLVVTGLAIMGGVEVKN
jgi:predicted membrane protein